jgi:hypothetical protein
VAFHHAADGYIGTNLFLLHVSDLPRAMIFRAAVFASPRQFSDGSARVSTG